MIKSHGFNVDLLRALYQFRNYLEPKEPQTKGKHFNYYLLSEAAELFKENHARFGNDYDSPKNLFFWQKVFGGVQRHVPACDAQNIAHGLWSLFHEEEESSRSLNFRSGYGKYFPLTANPDLEIGHNCAVSGWRGECVCAGAGYTVWYTKDAFQTLCQAKTSFPVFTRK
jgi:hypothetical protein